jgi:hypothetical protein
MPRLTAEAAQALVDGLAGDVEGTSMVQVISAFDTPQMRYDPIRAAFYQHSGPLSLQGAAGVCTPHAGG